jgi:hypothetical protein
LTVKNRFRDQTQEAKGACRVAADATDEAWVYCGSCHRAMRQGDCVLDGPGAGLSCAYDDCRPEGNLAFKSLYGWDAYRLAHQQETTEWPVEPESGRCYEPGAAP